LNRFKQILTFDLSHMGFFYRKSVNFGPFRVNLSKSGFFYRGRGGMIFGHFSGLSSAQRSKQSEFDQAWLQEERFSEDLINLLLSTNESSIKIAN